jgi:L-aspartate oxidase
MRKTGSRTVFLDMTAKGEEFLRRRFPQIAETCAYYGLDISKDMLPVSPASHYCMGGVRTDLWGRTTIPGLYAAGEVTCTGVHGANRLASNSLLEGLVFGARAGAVAAEEAIRVEVTGPADTAGTEGALNARISTAVRKRVKRGMWEWVGIMRDAESLKRALSEFEQIEKARLSMASRNFVTLASLVTRAALWREESRGGHFRSDFPERSDKWRVHSIQASGREISPDDKINFGQGD